MGLDVFYCIVLFPLGLDLRFDWPESDQIRSDQIISDQTRLD